MLLKIWGEVSVSVHDLGKLQAEVMQNKKEIFAYLIEISSVQPSA